MPPGDSGEHSPGPSPRPGRNIVVGGRDQQAAAQVEEEIRGLGVAVRTVLADVTRRADIERTLEETVSAFGRADVLVNNAGACIHKPAAEVTDDEWHAVMNVNLGGVWIASQVFGRHMIKSGGGSIINIGSMSGSIVNRPQWQPAYNASKAAMHHLTRSLAAEWAPAQVRVNALAAWVHAHGHVAHPRAAVPPILDRGHATAARGNRRS